MGKSEIEVLSTHRLETETRYAYCPYCYAEKKKALQSFEVKDVLQKLVNVKTKEMYIDAQGKLRVVYDMHQHCDNCNRDITVDDFYRFYVAKADGTRWFAPPKKEN